ncbi:hypothetical protein [Catenibacterium sp.]
MKKMQITAQLPKKDAYKGQATHHHECMAKPNSSLTAISSWE